MTSFARRSSADVTWPRTGVLVRSALPKSSSPGWHVCCGAHQQGADVHRSSSSGGKTSGLMAPWAAAADGMRHRGCGDPHQPQHRERSPLRARHGASPRARSRGATLRLIELQGKQEKKIGACSWAREQLETWLEDVIFQKRSLSFLNNVYGLCLNWRTDFCCFNVFYYYYYNFECHSDTNQVRVSQHLKCTHKKWNKINR